MAIAYVCMVHADPRDAQVAKALTLDEARRIASNIANLPSLFGKKDDEILTPLIEGVVPNGQ